MAAPIPLTDLYALVPAAEEEDLLEQVAQERDRGEQEELASAWMAWPARHPRVWDLWTGEATDDEDPAPELPVAEDLPPLRQVLGLLEHQLGAEVVVDEPYGGVALPRLDRPTEP